jgi:thiol:disulfide interchange protein DsbC
MSETTEDRLMRTRTLLLSLLMISSASVLADASTESVRQAIRKVSPDVEIQDLAESAIPGMYRATLSGVNGYVTADGRHFITGDLFDVKSRANLSEQERVLTHRELLRAADLSDAITFAPKDIKYTITVFTDVDCGYCRKLHGEIAKYLERGIAVRYVAYPRSGPNSESWSKMEAVWCDKDPAAALTRAKRGEAVTRSADCKTTAVSRHYALAAKFMIQGTPLIVLEDGRTIGGYVPAQRLLDMLKNKPT